MDQFVFTSKQKNLSFIMMAIGCICMGITWAQDDILHTRFWTNFLHNSLFFTGIGFVALFMLAGSLVAYAGWYPVLKRIWEAYSLFMIVGLALMLVIVAGIWGHFHHLYHWADAAEVAKDRILKGKSGFLNPKWYTVGTLLVIGIWYYFAVKLRKLSVDQDVGEPGLEHYKKSKIYSAIFLPIAGFSSAAMIWQWMMSLDAHWYSTMYAWYTTASWFVTMMAFTLLFVVYLKSKGYLTLVSTEHIHDIGKFMFAFSIFWTYLWFSQFMLIWYSNNGEETTYFKQRMDHYPILYWGNLILNFVAPFLILIRNDTKRKYGSMVLAAIIIIFGHWLDFFQMIKPGALHTAHEAIEKMGAHNTHVSSNVVHGAEQVSNFTAGFTIPGLLEIGTFIGFFGLFIFVVFYQLTRVSLVPKNDPFLQESIHHHV